MSLFDVCDQQMKRISLFSDVRVKRPTNEANIVVLAALPKDQPMKLGFVVRCPTHEANVQRRAKSILSLSFFYYIFHVKPNFLKTLFQIRLLFNFDEFFTNKNRIKCSFTL